VEPVVEKRVKTVEGEEMGGDLSNYVGISESKSCKDFLK